MSQYDYDLFTIGGGSGGVRAARFAGQAGARVGLAESGDLGGTCVNVGCIPKKLMSYSAHYHSDFSDAAGYGWRLDAQPGFDWNTLIANKDREIAHLNDIYKRLLDGANVALHRGFATVEDAHTVSVDGRRFTARHILVATGGHPERPDIPGKELGITSDDFFHLTALPKRAVVLGGGYIAVELASILNGLGSEVTLVYRGERLLRTMDADLGAFLADEMAKKGIRLVFKANIEAVEAVDAAQAGEHAAKTVRLSNGEALQAECVLFATGRRPTTSRLGLEKAGVALEKNGAIKVNGNFESSVPSILAVGDVIDRVALTPVALAEAMAVVSRLFGNGERMMSYQNIPTAVFSHPNIGTVGLSEEQARKEVGEVKIFKTEFKPLKHTLSRNTERTFMKLVVDAGSDRVLGVHMVGGEAGEIVQGFAVALQCGATKAQFDMTIGIHPTSAEEFVTMRTPVA
ncbi:MULTISPECIES: glutathione-disulfide reductase [unclassified Herbaspirillum]|uniref:glutathione-disulfide reductase n=1 Tax=unclassified Herbaspirillum TaxID=2624150 RepID=UPI00114D62B2|nr:MULTISPECIES: glutathione-disulfide reductase [unclassified Herbaspirillum]MBB5391903.1 glutathione reductase (NADPH) [Herbaspirillum sp. SJZ102]TQK13363.1 NADPH-glutathione reductase [Herbaspirillum sp. SJZ130]TQK15367.1 NADPH-glutathione reductase [Herbaspirillum sp. SJZ106]TWC71262.1 NADPH-glutathione reductase [Herbaspirillum sp. SJZ099]